MSKRSRCGAARMCLDLGELTAGIVRVGSVLLWPRASFSYFDFLRHGLWRLSCGLRACFRNRVVAGLIRGSSGSTTGTFKCASAEREREREEKRSSLAQV